MASFNLTITLSANPHQSIKDFQASVLETLGSVEWQPMELRFEPLDDSDALKASHLRLPDMPHISYQGVLVFIVEDHSVVSANELGRKLADTIERQTPTFLIAGRLTERRFEILKWKIEDAAKSTTLVQGNPKSNEEIVAVEKVIPKDHLLCPHCKGSTTCKCGTCGNTPFSGYERLAGVCNVCKGMGFVASSVKSP